jgi:cell wall-associated NlpC family hydrolase
MPSHGPGGGRTEEPSQGAIPQQTILPADDVADGATRRTAFRRLRRFGRRPVRTVPAVLLAAALALLPTAAPAGAAPQPSAAPTAHPSATPPSPAGVDPAAATVPDPAVGAAVTGTDLATAPQSDPSSPSYCTPTAPEPPAPPAPVITGGLYDNVHLSDDQAQTAQLIIAVGKAMGITERGVQIALAVAMQESSLHPWQVAGPYVGLFQQLADPDSGKYTEYDRSSAVGATRMFYDQLVQTAPGYQADTRKDWQIGELIQQTGLGTLFDRWHTLSADLTQRFYDSVPPYEFYPKPAPVTLPTDCPATTGGSGFDPGNIISDRVFYDSTAMTADQVRAFIDQQNAACQGDWCLRNLRVDTPDVPADRYCDGYAGAAGEDAAAVIAKVALACHVNPQVMLVTLQKESALLTRTDVSAASYSAAWGWHCPDTGPGGSANCDPEYAGFFPQAYGMAKQWARYRLDPGKYHYQAGETAEVLWNVAATGCGGAPVHIQNTATASLYNYTPYQPNAASLAAYPGTGDQCSSYGNRNFFFLFVRYFGSTGGGTAVGVDGVAVTIPDSPYVPRELVGATITAPTPAMAQGIAAGLATLGTPYVWGGGTAGGPADQGCARGGGASNSCQGLVGFDCSGLTGYVLSQAGFDIPDNSSAQRAAGESVSWDQGRPGDIIGYPGHVAIYLGEIDGTRYLLESPYPGAFVHIRSVYSSSGGSPVDGVLHRYWG